MNRFDDPHAKENMARIKLIDGPLDGLILEEEPCKPWVPTHTFEDESRPGYVWVYVFKDDENYVFDGWEKEC